MTELDLRGIENSQYGKFFKRNFTSNEDKEICSKWLDKWGQEILFLLSKKEGTTLCLDGNDLRPTSEISWAKEH